MWYGLLADLIVAVHFVFMAFILFGQLAIVVGAIRRWSWIRNPWFRFGHLVSILIVALEAVVNMPCPLTIWEDQLRTLAGQEPLGGTFIGRWAHYLLFYEIDPEIFNLCYILFALLVLVTFLVAPPRLCRRKAAEPAPSFLPASGEPKPDGEANRAAPSPPVSSAQSGVPSP